MKIWTWLKSLSWIAIAGAIGTAALMIINARRAGALEVTVAHGESQIKELNKGSAADIHAARKLQSQIDAKKIDARLVRKKSEASLERLGQDETMADIAARFNGSRVRRRKDAAP
jgi:uncharacterized coiled-coil protein SlyX